MLSHKFTGASKNIYWKEMLYGTLFDDDIDEFNKEKERLKKYNLRDIDECLVLSLIAPDALKFGDYISYGANPWANIGDDDCVWKRIMSNSRKMMNDILDITFTRKNDFNMPSFLEKLLQTACYLAFYMILKKYNMTEDLGTSPIKTIPRILYSSEFFPGAGALELAYDSDTGRTEISESGWWYACDIGKVKIPEEIIKQLLSPESIRQFMYPEQGSNPLDIEELTKQLMLKIQDTTNITYDGPTYYFKMIDSDGNIREISCNDINKDRFPQVCILQDYISKCINDDEEDEISE